MATSSTGASIRIVVVLIVHAGGAHLHVRPDRVERVHGRVLYDARQAARRAVRPKGRRAVPLFPIHFGNFSVSRRRRCSRSSGTIATTVAVVGMGVVFHD